MKYLAFVEQGEGQVVVLLHGFCETKELWQDFIPVLAQNYRVIAPDLTGFGESEKLVEEGITIAKMATQVYDLLQFLGVSKCTLIGHSLGGYVGLAFAKQYGNNTTGVRIISFHSPGRQH